MARRVMPRLQSRRFALPVTRSRRGAPALRCGSARKRRSPPLAPPADQRDRAARDRPQTGSASAYTAGLRCSQRVARLWARGVVAVVPASCGGSGSALGRFGESLLFSTAE